MKMQDYIEYMLAAENAPAMQLRALDHRGKFTSSEIRVVGENIRDRFNNCTGLKEKFTVKASDLVNFEYTFLFPNGDTSNQKSISISGDPYRPIQYGYGGKRYAYRFKLNYKVHVDPVTTMLDMLPVHSS
jgi:hypothetical protein